DVLDGIDTADGADVIGHDVRTTRGAQGDGRGAPAVRETNPLNVAERAGAGHPDRLDLVRRRGAAAGTAGGVRVPGDHRVAGVVPGPVQPPGASVYRRDAQSPTRR